MTTFQRPSLTNTEYSNLGSKMIKAYVLNDHLVTDTTSVQDYLFAKTMCTKFIVMP